MLTLQNLPPESNAAIKLLGIPLLALEAVRKLKILCLASAPNTYLTEGTHLPDIVHPTFRQF